MNERQCKVTVPLLTPLSGDGNIDYRGFGKLVAHCVQGGVSGFLILGTNGEGYLHAGNVRLDVIRHSEDFLSGFQGMRLYGVLEHSTDEAVAFIKRAMDLGAEKFAIVPPFYDAVTQGDIVRHYEKIAGVTRARMFIYNLPSLTGVNIEIETVKKLKRLPGVLGIKNSSGDMFYFMQLLSRVKSEDFPVFQGSEELALPSILLGADGIIPCGANVFPAFFVWLARMAGSVSTGDYDEIIRLSGKILDLQNMTSYWIASLKGACESLGLIGRDVSSPYTGMSDGEIPRCRTFTLQLEKEIEEAMKSKR
ncbi:MAG: dihydrodipicolinate synthase family protein [Spirochaetes bacterium]|nr:dihydrodipicolinate synthase family protein [Spirochaetota bacterium]